MVTASLFSTNIIFAISLYPANYPPHLTVPLFRRRRKFFLTFSTYVFFFYRKIVVGLTVLPYFPENMLEGGEVRWVWTDEDYLDDIYKKINNYIRKVLIFLRILFEEKRQHFVPLVFLLPQKRKSVEFPK